MEKSINAELEKARLTQEQNLMLENELTSLERRNKRVALGYKSQLAQQKEKYELKLKVLECELEHKNNISYDNPSPELRKALAERGYLLMDKNMFNLLSVNLGASLCKGISRILGSSYPKCLMQLTDVGIIELKNYFHKNININQGLPFMLEECKIRQVDNCYSPIYNKWVIEEGVQDERWELELRYKH